MKLIIFSIITIFIILGYIISVNHVMPAIEDEAIHLESAIKYYQILNHPAPSMFWRILNVDSLWPPLVPLTGAVFASFFKYVNLNAFLQVNVMYLFIGLISVYLIGKKVHSAQVGCLAMFIFSAYPMVSLLYNCFMIEFALTAIMSVYICCLVYSDNFKRSSWTLLMAIFAALGLLAKWTFLIYCLVPYAYCVFNYHKKGSNIRWFRDIIFNCIYLAIFLPWYIIHMPNLRTTFPFAFVQMGTAFQIFSLSDICFYPSALFSGISPVLSLICIASIIWLSCRYALKNSLLNIIFCWAAVPLLVLSVLTNKWAHYISPILPALSILSAVGIVEFIRRVGSSMIRASILGVILVMFILNAVIAPIYCNNIHIEAPKQIRNLFMWKNTDLNNPFLRTQHEKMDQIITLVDSMQKQSNKEISVGVVDYMKSIYFNLRYVSRLRHQKGVQYISYLYQPDVFLKHIDQMELLIINFDKSMFENVHYSEEVLNLNLRKIQRMLKMSESDTMYLKEKLDKLINDFEIVKVYKIYSMAPGSDSIICIFKKSNHEAASKRSDVPAILREIYDKEYMHRSAVLDNGMIKLKFMNSYWGIFYKGKELTQGRSLCTSVQSWDIGYDSSRYDWDILESDANKIIAIGYCRGVPVRQIWTFKMSQGRILWHVDLDILGMFKSDSYFAKIMLSNAYDHWNTSERSGAFTVRSNISQHGASAIRSRATDTYFNWIRASDDSGNMPPVIFAMTNTYRNVSSCADNSDPEFTGNSVLFFIKNNSKFGFNLPGDRISFDGYIAIGESRK